MESNKTNPKRKEPFTNQANHAFNNYEFPYEKFANNFYLKNFYTYVCCLNANRLFHLLLDRTREVIARFDFVVGLLFVVR